MRNEELKLPEHNYDELSIKSRFTALTANDQPPVGALQISAVKFCNTEF